MQIFDRVFDRHDMAAPRAVDPVDERGQRRALAGPGRPGHQHQPVGQVAQFVQAFGQAQVGQRAEAVFQPPQGDRHAALPAKHIEAEPRAVGGRQRAVERAAACPAAATAIAGRSSSAKLLQSASRNRSMILGRPQHAVNAKIRRQLGRQVQVGSILPHAIAQQPLEELAHVLGCVVHGGADGRDRAIRRARAVC